MVVLGLLMREPDTAAGVKERLVETLPSARWTRSIGHSTFASLAQKRSIRIIERGAQPSEDRYETTRKGREEFLEWMHAPLTVLPALRDALHVKLLLCEPDDLPWFVGVIREYEEAFYEAAEQAQIRLNKAWREGRLGSGDDEDLKSWVLGLMMTEEASLWHEMAKRKKRLRIEFERRGIGGETPNGGGLDA
jgi:DNA-binding PadR family transcriptional regulator